jgi:predicted DCC family thiol-disulfide oxidoreductase YuxK
MYQKTTSGHWLIIYDARCSFCLRQIDKIKKHDTKNIFEYIPNDSPDIFKKFPQLKGKDLSASLWLIAPDGTLYSAADAVYQIMLRLEKYRSIAWLYRLPLLHWAAQLAYRWTASHRK